jgi:hypothetical protein
MSMRGSLSTERPSCSLVMSIISPIEALRAPGPTNGFLPAAR